MLAGTIESTRLPVLYKTCLVVGLGGLFAGVTGPLLSNFVPPLVRDVLGDNRSAIGAVMAIDNVLLLLLVPWAGAASDRRSARGQGRLAIVLCGFALAAAGMAVFSTSTRFGLPGLIATMVVLYSGINLQRSPFQALIADLVPSAHRSLATASVTFQMCVAAIVFLMLAQTLGMRTAFAIAAVTVLAIALAFVAGLREPPTSDPRVTEATIGSVLKAARTALSGAVPGMRKIFIASLLLQLTFRHSRRGTRFTAPSDSDSVPRA